MAYQGDEMEVVPLPHHHESCNYQDLVAYYLHNQPYAGRAKEGTVHDLASAEEVDTVIEVVVLVAHILERIPSPFQELLLAHHNYLAEYTEGVVVAESRVELVETEEDGAAELSCNCECEVVQLLHQDLVQGNHHLG